MKIAIVGGTGNISQPIVRRLLEIAGSRESTTNPTL